VSRALVTGGAGFIGTHLVGRLVNDGYDVDVVDDFSRGVRDAAVTDLERSGHVRLLERDLRSPGALSGMDTGYSLVVHLAAIVGVANVLARPRDVLWDNVRMLEEALSLAGRQRSLERLVFASTSEVYAGSLEHGTLPFPTPETAPLTVPGLDRPRTSYMLSKIYGEAMCRQAGVPVTIIRPHNVYGPRMGMAHVIPELLHRAHTSTDGRLEVYSVDHRRTFCYVEDAVELIVRAARSPNCEGETLNVGTQAPEISIGELATVICGVVGRDLEIVSLPATAGSPSRRCPDISKAVELTGFMPRVALEDGVRRTHEYYRAAAAVPAA
jgi:nucleoside-diphosphate-sugar epimerase